MSAANERDDECPNPMLDGEDEDDGDWREYDDDPDYEREPDYDDYAIARDYQEYAEHCMTVHGGGECTCGPSLAVRAWQLAREIGNGLRDPWRRLTAATWQPWTLRIGPAEVTLRLHANRRCGACDGKGWLYTLNRSRADDRPPGYNGTALCGCGSATARLAESRRRLRQTLQEPPF